MKLIAVGDFVNKLRYLILFVFITVILVIVPFASGEAAPYLDALAKIAATGGLLGLLYQFMRERDLNEADFILRINNSFINNSNIASVYKRLESSKGDHCVENPFNEEDITDIANYLVLFEPFYDLIRRNVVHIESIDSVLAYRFFLATNNQFVQKMLLCLEIKEEAWSTIHKLYDYWKNYRIKRKRVIWGIKFDLRNTEAHKRVTGKN